MKNTYQTLLVSALVALPSLAFAQAANANAAANSAVQAAGHVPTIVPPTVQAGGAAQAAGGANAAARPPVSVPPVSANAGAHVGGALNASTTGQAQASAHAAPVAQANSSSVSALNRADLVVTANPAATVSEIRGASFAARRDLATRIEARIDATEAKVAELRARADAAGDKTRSEFGRAMREIRAKQKELRESLKASVRASGESTWGEVQSTLAKDYDAYASAVANAEVVAQGSATTPSTR